VHHSGAPPNCNSGHMKPYPDIVVSGSPDQSNGRYVYSRQFNAKPEWKHRRYTRGRPRVLRWSPGAAQWTFGAYTNKSDTYLPPATGWRDKRGRPIGICVAVEHRTPISLCSSDEEEINTVPVYTNKEEQLEGFPEKEIAIVPEKIAAVALARFPELARLNTDEVFHELLPRKSQQSPTFTRRRGFIPRRIPGWRKPKRNLDPPMAPIHESRNLDPPMPPLELPPTRKRRKVPKKKTPPQTLQTKQVKTAVIPKGNKGIPAELLGQRLRDWALAAPTEALKKEMAARLRTMGFDVTDDLLTP